METTTFYDVTTLSENSDLRFEARYPEDEDPIVQIIVYDFREKIDMRIGPNAIGTMTLQWSEDPDFEQGEPE